ncbi:MULTISPECIES: hypothetical protein [unclassified Flavobacterium]|uniref:hypothetical protein n=1 Tax=unclassified Flavobacterium TaxID=196869 RepID=UPI00131D033A|nr:MULTISPECIES: hypothetical protein [unclassified Flavobacterium]
MNQNIKNQYKINFVNKISKNDNRITKIPNLNNIIFSEFLFNWNSEEINESLLPDINLALANPNSEIENGSETNSILIYQDKVDFYNDNGFAYRLPTQDFKEIVIGWRDFLLTPPFNGTKI